MRAKALIARFLPEIADGLRATAKLAEAAEFGFERRGGNEALRLLFEEGERLCAIVAMLKVLSSAQALDEASLPAIATGRKRP